MNTFVKSITAALLTTAVVAGPLAAFGADAKADAKIKPYTLPTCIVSGDKLGEMGPPFVYTNGDRQIKFCCKDCVKDFKKDPAKYVKKIEEAEAKAAK